MYTSMWRIPALFASYKVEYLYVRSVCWCISKNEYIHTLICSIPMFRKSMSLEVGVCASFVTEKQLWHAMDCLGQSVLSFTLPVSESDIAFYCFEFNPTKTLCLLRSSLLRTCDFGVNADTILWTPTVIPNDTAGLSDRLGRTRYTWA